MHVCDMAEALGATTWPGLRPGGYRYPSTNTKHLGSVILILIPGTDRPGDCRADRIPGATVYPRQLQFTPKSSAIDYTRKGTQSSVSSNSKQS